MFKKVLLTGVAAGSIIAASSAAHAGGFALREQSAAGQGLSFAGSAAGGAGLGSMFWNPATMTDNKGIQTSIGLTGILPYASLTNISGTGAGYSALTGKSSSGDIAQDGVVPNGNVSWQLNQSFWLGLSINAPYGLATKPDSSYVGRTYGSTTRASSKEIATSVAYKANEMVSVAAGIRYLDLKARYTTAAAQAGVAADNWSVLGLQGDGAAIGYTLGITLKPMANTEIGLGYRSEVNPTLKGNFFGGAAAAPSFGGSATLAAYALDNPIQVSVPLPQMITLGVNHKATKDLTLLAGFEWTQWSKLKAPAVTYRNSGSYPAANISWSPGSLHIGSPYLPFDYKDGWYASLGGEYNWNSKLTLRSGLAFESTPIKDASRSTRLPDNDRVWASVGAGYKLSDQLSLDFGYTHIFPKSTKVTILDASNPNYKSSYSTAQIDKLNADVKAHVDIIALSLTYRWDDPAPAKAANKITK